MLDDALAHLGCCFSGAAAIWPVGLTLPLVFLQAGMAQYVVGDVGYADLQSGAGYADVVLFCCQSAEAAVFLL
jgi:hypothetical protein